MCRRLSVYWTKVYNNGTLYHFFGCVIVGCSWDGNSRRRVICIYIWPWEREALPQYHITTEFLVHLLLDCPTSVTNKTFDSVDYYLTRLALTEQNGDIPAVLVGNLSREFSGRSGMIRKRGRRFSARRGVVGSELQRFTAVAPHLQRL